MEITGKPILFLNLTKMGNPVSNSVIKIIIVNSQFTKVTG